ncbi:MAG: TonB-dependent receptor [Flavobacteriia bacterium]|nr:TonB-dependent receptor [Flavobacteriia bacterium]
MKLKITLLFLIVNISSIYSQIVEILDKNTLVPINGVSVSQNSDQSNPLLSDLNGKIDISSFKNTEVLYFKKKMYDEISFTKEELAKVNYVIYLVENTNSLDEVVVSASKFEEKRRDVVQRIQVLRTSDLQNMNQTSTADVMSNSGNVLVQKSQQGGGSPIIRGFETNKVLMVVDGVRMNNAIYRGGHLQNIITLDNSVFDKIEVAFGPGSVVYGSDALGGVMHFYTKNPLLSESNKIKIAASAFTRYTTANSGSAAHTDISIGNSKVASLTSFSYSNYGDLRQGAVRNPYYGNFGSRNWYVKQINGIDSLFVNNDTNLQIGSSYSQIDFLQKILFKQSEKVNHILNFQYSTSSNIDRYDRLTLTNDGKPLTNLNNPKFGTWYYGPQKRMFGSYTLNLTNNNRIYDHARIIVGYQNIEESRIDRKYKKSIENHHVEKLDIITFNADFDNKLGKNEIRFGIDAYYNKVNSTAFGKNLKMDTVGLISTRYSDGGSAMYSIAGYFTHTWEISKKIILNDGIRFSNVNLNSKWINKTFFPFPFENVIQKNNAVNGNIGIVYMPNNTSRFTAGVSSGFRAPNVDDLSKVFESTQGNIIVPNPNIKPEYTYTYELGISQLLHKKILVSLNGYYTNYVNALTTQNFTFNGQDSIIYDGVMSKVTATTNAAKAYIYGLESSISGNLNEYLSVLGSFNYTYGRIVTDTTDYPLDHIAPIFGKVSFNVKLKKFRGEFFVNYNGWKRMKDYNLMGEDNESNATPFGMPAWYTANIRLTYQFNKYISLQAACENIFDQNYRQFASNISAPGRNFIVTLRGNF